MSDWPRVELDPVERLRAMAAGLRGCAYLQGVIDAPRDDVWGVVGDLEEGVPRFEGTVSAAAIVHREGDRLVLDARTRLGRMRFDVVLRPGWCVMRSRFANVGMAARAEGDGRTRFAHFEHARVGSFLARPFQIRNVRADLERLANLFA